MSKTLKPIIERIAKEEKKVSPRKNQRINPSDALEIFQALADEVVTLEQVTKAYGYSGENCTLYAVARAFIQSLKA